MKSFDELVEIVRRLRGPGGCPWDREQTHESLTPYAIEEAHELEQAIENKDDENMKEELGDLLFQSVLHAQLADEDKKFSIDDVLKHLNHKMVSRHPHVFASKEVKDSQEVVANWEDIKAKEKGPEKAKDIFDIPQSFPALLRAQKIGKRTKKMKFDWDTPEQVFSKVEEEMAELKEAMENKNSAAIEEELGDLLFTVAQVVRHCDLDAEKTLRKANSKFIGRFQKMLELRPDFESLSPQEKEELWNRVKQEN